MVHYDPAQTPGPLLVPLAASVDFHRHAEQVLFSSCAAAFFSPDKTLMLLNKELDCSSVCLQHFVSRTTWPDPDVALTLLDLCDGVAGEVCMCSILDRTSSFIQELCISVT